MNELVKREFTIQVKQINRELESVINGESIPKELTQMQFDGIRMLLDYCEKLAQEGENAIDKFRLDELKGKL